MNFELMSKEELVVLCNKYKRYLEYNENRVDSVDVEKCKGVYEKLANGSNYNKLAKEYGVTAPTIKNWVRKYADMKGLNLNFIGTVDDVVVF